MSPTPSPSPSSQGKRDHLFQQFARIGSALSSPQRLRMLSLLCHKERSVEELASLTAQSIASASAHLKALRGACLIQSQKQGRHVIIQLADPSVLRFWLEFRDFSAALLPEAREVVQQYFSDKTQLSPITPEELYKELQENRVTLLDLRPAEEYSTDHIPTARNIPFRSLSLDLEQIKGFTTADPIYAYCRGPYCIMAHDGVEYLRRHGVPVLQLSFSLPEWQKAGLPSEH